MRWLLFEIQQFEFTLAFLLCISIYGFHNFVPIMGYFNLRIGRIIIIWIIYQITWGYQLRVLLKDNYLPMNSKCYIITDQYPILVRIHINKCDIFSDLNHSRYKHFTYVIADPRFHEIDSICIVCIVMSQRFVIVLHGSQGNGFRMAISIVKVNLYFLKNENTYKYIQRLIRNCKINTYIWLHILYWNIK